MTLPAIGPDVSVRFAGSNDGAPVFGPVPADSIAEDTSRFGAYWSPTLEGSVATIEFRVPAETRLDGVTLTIPRISHHMVAGLALKQPDAKTVQDIS